MFSCVIAVSGTGVVPAVGWSVPTPPGVTNTLRGVDSPGGNLMEILSLYRILYLLIYLPESVL